MTRRVAKKVLRRVERGEVPRWHLELRANHASWRDRRRSWRFGLTPGWRWGRWDPSLSRNPLETPF